MQDSSQTVVVSSGDGIKFVVMATCTGDRQSQKGFCQNIELIVDLVGPSLDRVGRRVQDLTKPEDPRTDRRLPERTVLTEALIGNQIAGNLLADKSIIGQVLVEGPDDIVPITPGIQLVIVIFVAVGLRKPHQVQPVSGPSFPVVLRIQ